MAARARVLFLVLLLSIGAPSCAPEDPQSGEAPTELDEIFQSNPSPHSEPVAAAPLAASPAAEADVITHPAEPPPESASSPVSPLPVENPAPPSRSIDPLYANLPKLYRDYGPLYAEEGEWEGEAAVRPWSAWWYPIRDRHLFEGKTEGVKSVLEKYDQFVREVSGSDGGATAYEREHLYRPDAEGWEGLCHAWALASLLEPEPVAPVTRAGITFGIADQKALLIKTYEQYFVQYYGRKYEAAGVSDWNQISPHLFHRFVLGELIERGRPFIMNKVPGMEIWNVPVWKAVTEVRRDSARPSVFHVTTWIVEASVLDRPSEQTGGRSEVNVYTYDLFTEKDREGRELVISGKWTGASVDLHPSILVVFPERNQPFAHQSRNPNIKNSRVLEILKSL